jgi:hypothetical protein
MAETPVLKTDRLSGAEPYSRPTVSVIKANNIIFAEIRTYLNFDQFKRNFTGIFQRMDFSRGNID